ncbi:PrgI family protein [Actinotignum sp. GS-2025b]|uniref:PrgI family protein n=1 Tax=Actinotignum sp. GS-2025b TaxID=3427275 RepID=UPI003F46D8C3
MAFEVHIYREVTAYQPKVLFGFSWRQLGALSIALPVAGLAYWGCYRAGLDDLGILIVFAVMVPAAMFGWWRPMGIPAEKYIGYAWEYRFGRRRYLYHQITDVGFSDGQKNTTTARRGRSGRLRREYVSFETNN